MKSSREETIKKAYEGFNRRDIEKVLLLMHSCVTWPKAFEGTFVTGHDAIGQYWTQQWNEINPHVQPVSIHERPNGTTEVTVHQLVKDLQGNVLFEGMVKHIYSFKGSFIAGMEVAAEN